MTIQKRLYQDVEKLSKVKPARNSYNIKILNEVAEYIFNRMSETKAEVSYHNYPVEGKEYKNIIARIGSPDKACIVVGAHYDVDGEQPGADDNASAVAGMLELLRMVDKHEGELKYRFEFVAYCLEEQPYCGTEYMGSAIHALGLFKNKVDVKAMVCLEMIGYFSDLPNSQFFPDEQLKKIYPNTGNFIILVGKTGQEDFVASSKSAMKKYCNIGVESIILPVTHKLAELSDHRNYWKYNYNAIMVNDTAFLRNPNYHKVTDTIDTLNFEKMEEVIHGVFGILISM